MLGLFDAAHAYDGDAAAEARAHAADHVDGALPQRRSAQASGADGVDLGRRRRQAASRDRRVGRDHAVETDLVDHGEHVFELGVGEVGRNLHEEPLARAGLRAQRRQERVGVLARLHRAEAGGVGRRDVHDHEVGDGVHRVERGEVVVDHGGEVVYGHDARLADRDADGHPFRGRRAASHFAEALREARGALVREAEPVYERAIGRQAKEVRSGVGRLRLRRDRPELEVPEPERRERPRSARVLVEAAREADDRRKVEAHDARADPTRGRAAAARGRRAGEQAKARAHPGEVLHRAQRGEREFVRRVRRKEKEQRPERTLVHDGLHGPCRFRPA